MASLAILLVLLGLLTYFVLRRSVAELTRTPLWLLWLVMMGPAFVWTGWIAFAGEDRPMPVLLALAPFIVFPILYVWLVQIGRRDTARVRDRAPSPAAEADAPEAKAETAAAGTSPPAASLLAPDEEARLRNCFPWSVYYLQQLDRNPQAILCRGKLRAVPETAYGTVRDNIEAEFADRFLVIFQDGFRGDPFFALVPNPRAKDRLDAASDPPLNRPGLWTSLLATTVLTAAIAGARFAAAGRGIGVEEFVLTRELLWAGLPYLLGALAVFAAYGFSSYGMAHARNLRVSLPYFFPIPIPPGIFGGFVRLQSPVPHRRALFDLAIAGPLGGLLVTVPVLLWGLLLSEPVPLAEESGPVALEAFDPRFSLFIASSAKLMLGERFAPETAIALHPLAIAGYWGLVVMALRLMPVGRLDGGHIVHAIYGMRTAAIVGQVARLLVLILATLEPAYLLFVVPLFFMPIFDEPALNDVTELDNTRDAIGFASLVFLLTLVLPVPQTVAQWLNI